MMIRRSDLAVSLSEEAMDDCGRDGTFPICNPYTGTEVGRAPRLGPDEVRRRLEVCRRFSPRLTGTERAEILLGASRHYAQHLEEAALLIVDEAGICLKQARHEVERAVEGLKAAARQARLLDEEDPAEPYRVPEEAAKARMEVIAEPVRLAVGITPFNHPLNQVVHKAAPAVAAGACMVLKPSEKTPLSALYLERVLRGCGLPEPMLAIVGGEKAEVVESLVTCQGAELVSFTGSVEVGKAILRMMASRGNELAHYVPELGGNAALVVHKDADLALAARIALGAYDNAGQRCTAVKRILVHERVADDFLDLFLTATTGLAWGDPYDERTDLGPVIDEQAARRIEARVESALRHGARLLAGHRRQGALYAPTLLDRVRPDMELVRCETFGPAAPVMRVKSLEECIDIVRAGRFRLAGAIVTSDQDTARRYAKAIGVGQFSWNGPPGYRTESAPFGGFGDSGNGEKEGIIAATRSMLRLRTFYSH
ncbi:MAG: aldehyde dehydrogenase family protein [Acidobacteriota bacterium]